MKRHVVILLSFLVSSVGCSMMGVGNRGAIDPKAKAEQEREIRKADRVLESQNHQEAERLYREFQLKFPNSFFYQYSQMGIGKSLAGQEKWVEAAELYRQTLEVTRTYQPEIAAQALVELSVCYENLGDETRVLASLQDALQLKEHLTQEQVLAEIPARLAASYNRMGRTQEAERYFKEAAKGIHQMRPSHTVDETGVWLARTYYRMGAFSTNQLSFENLQTSLDTLKMVQIFSLRGAEAGGEPWSRKAANELIANYRDIWNLIRRIPQNDAMEAGAAQREQVDRQVNYTGQLLTLMNELRTYRSPDHSGESTEAGELFLTLGKVEKQAHQFLNSLGGQTLLTPEAQKRRSLKR